MPFPFGTAATGPVNTVGAMALAFLCCACGRTEPTRLTPAQNDAGVRCTNGTVIATQGVARVLLLVDRSGSMNFDMEGNFGGLFGPPMKGPTRWSILRETLRGVLPRHQAKLAVGLAFFPSNDDCGGSVALAVEPRRGNGADVLAAFARFPGGGTPTTASVTAGAALATATKATAMVLVTDGEPNCNASQDPNTCSCTAPRLGFPPTCPSAENCSDANRAIDALSPIAARVGPGDMYALQLEAAEAEGLLAMKRPRDGLANVARALEGMKANEPVSPEIIGRVLVAAAQTTWAAGKKADAEPLTQRALEYLRSRQTLTKAKTSFEAWVANRG
jgi:hypothetical protein